MTLPDNDKLIYDKIYNAKYFTSKDIKDINYFFKKYIDPKFSITCNCGGASRTAQMKLQKWGKLNNIK